MSNSGGGGHGPTVHTAPTALGLCHTFTRRHGRTAELVKPNFKLDYDDSSLARHGTVEALSKSVLDSAL